jgi:hypothetical protein
MLDKIRLRNGTYLTVPELERAFLSGRAPKFVIDLAWFMSQGAGRLVGEDGTLRAARVERILFSAATAHLYDLASQAALAQGHAAPAFTTEGNLALNPQWGDGAPTGWQTYNFEVAEHHTYVAGGVRVHNDSAPDVIEANDGAVRGRAEGSSPCHARARTIKMRKRGRVPDTLMRLATLDDWRSGETVRVMATVAPFGGEVRL